jgi:hypothetical protein
MRRFSIAKASRGGAWKKAVRSRMAKWCEQGDGYTKIAMLCYCSAPFDVLDCISVARRWND